jgi:hypothetical protein
MNYIDKVLQEFDEKFNDSFKYNAMEGLKSAGVVKSFLKQALEEQREFIPRQILFYAKDPQPMLCIKVGDEQSVFEGLYDKKIYQFYNHDMYLTAHN